MDEKDTNMKNRFYGIDDRGIIPDAVHGRSLPYPIRTFHDEETAYTYFLARYRNYIKAYEKNVTEDELWNIKADLLAIIHSFSTPKSQPVMDVEECIATIDVLFCHVCPESWAIPPEPQSIVGARARL